jgi:hypothetical protein
MKIKIDNPLRGIQHDLSREPYIAGMWAETKSMAHHAQRVENLLSIECKLQAAQNCPDDWLTAWAKMAALSLGEMRDLNAAVVSELEQLAHVYRTLRSEL